MIATACLSSAVPTPPRYEAVMRSYPIDSRVDAFVESTVERCLSERVSLDDTINAIARCVRTVAPNDLLQTDPEWEPRWRAYFALYDHAIMHAIRAYVERECGGSGRAAMRIA